MRRSPPRASYSQHLVLALAALAVPVASQSAADDLPVACRHEWWRAFLSVTRNVCKAGNICMYHPLLNEQAVAAIAHNLNGYKAESCKEGLASAGAFILRNLGSRFDSAMLVDIREGQNGSRVLQLDSMLWGRHVDLELPFGFSFQPFPYDVTSLVPYRVRTWPAIAELYSGATTVLTQGAVPHFAWIGAVRFWSELSSALEEAWKLYPDMFPNQQQPRQQEWTRVLEMPPFDYAVDIAVPLCMEAQVLSLNSDFEHYGRYDPTKRYRIHSVDPGRLAQIIFTDYPDFGEGIDVRELCPNCLVVNLIFYDEVDGNTDGKLFRFASDAEPCLIERSSIFPLQRIDGIEGFPPAYKGEIGSGLMPRTAFTLIADVWETYFEKQGQPCAWDFYELPPTDGELAEDVSLGPVSAFVARDLAAEDLGKSPDDKWEATPFVDVSGEFSGVWGCLPATDYSAEVMQLKGVHGWFDFMEIRMSSKRPALQGFQQKVWMKRLMQERQVRIPRLYHTSMDTPELPFEPPVLPRVTGGFCIKPAHLAESHHTFALLENGYDLLSGEFPTLEIVQGNISMSWNRSLGDYDNRDGGGCAVSGVFAEHLGGRACTNWALYHCPPGVLIEELVQPSPWYAHFRDSILSGFTREDKHPPDEIKCHVVWGKVFICEWVTPKLKLGLIYKHGFVKDTILISPEFQRRCFVDKDDAQCDFKRWWRQVVTVAERAVPRGVDYMRVDIFPNGWDPVVNELSVAGYSTLLEGWMLEELLRRVQRGYRARGAKTRLP